MWKIFLKITFFTICLNSISCAYDRQLIVAVSATKEYSALPITQATVTSPGGATISAGTMTLDNIITYKIKYYDTTELTTYNTDIGTPGQIFGASNSGGAITTYLYHYIKRTGEDTVSPDSDEWAAFTATPASSTAYTGFQYVQYNRPQYFSSAPSGPYVVFNLSEFTLDCNDKNTRTQDAYDTAEAQALLIDPLDTAAAAAAGNAAAATILGGPLFEIQAAFYCSDEEAKSVYDATINAVTGDINSSVAWIDSNGNCIYNPDAQAQFLIGGKLRGGNTICDILQGKATTTLCD